VAWNADGKQSAVIQRLRSQVGGLCSKLGAASDDRTACLALLKPAAKKSA
jgi:hypothetical protein